MLLRETCDMSFYGHFMRLPHIHHRYRIGEDSLPYQAPAFREMLVAMAVKSKDYEILKKILELVLGSFPKSERGEMWKALI